MSTLDAVAAAIPGLPPGLTARRPRLADLPGLVRLCRDDEGAVIGEATTSAAEIEEMLAPAHSRPEDDQWVVVDDTGRLVGWGVIWDHGATDHQDVDVYRAPSLGSEDVRAALLDTLLVRMAERARARGYPRIVTGAGCYHADTAYASTLRSRCFAHVRTFHRMRIDLDPHHPLAVEAPAGVEVVPFEPTEDAWRTLHAVVDESFSQHWGYAPVTYEAYRAAVEAEVDPDLPRWRVALDGGAIVGVSRASGRNVEAGGGWVGELAVLPSHRGRGVARALLQASFEANRHAGRTWVGLAVDTENTTGAVRVYESAGMRVEQQIDAYERDVSA